MKTNVTVPTLLLEAFTELCNRAMNVTPGIIRDQLLARKVADEYSQRYHPWIISSLISGVCLLLCGIGYPIICAFMSWPIPAAPTFGCVLAAVIGLVLIVLGICMAERRSHLYVSVAWHIVEAYDEAYKVFCEVYANRLRDLENIKHPHVLAGTIELHTKLAVKSLIGIWRMNDLTTSSELLGNATEKANALAALCIHLQLFGQTEKSVPRNMTEFQQAVTKLRDMLVVRVSEDLEATEGKRQPLATA